jgi:protoporphyrinogen oxidase
MRVAVIGAGMGGLTAAHRLARGGHDVDVYERWPGLGGQAASLDVGDGHRVERYYHVILRTDSHLRGLYDELGIGSELEWHRSSVAMLAGGELHPFTTPLDLLRYRPLSLRSRIRMGWAVLRLQRGARDSRPFEDVTVRDWTTQAMGREVYDKVWGPLLRGKFGDRADDIAMAWLWSKLVLRRELKGEEARHELLGYGRGGWEPLWQALEQAITAGGGRVLIDRPAARIARSREGGFEVTGGAPDSFRRGHDPRGFEAAGEPERYDGVIATVPNDVFEQLLDPGLAEEVGEDYFGRLRSCEYHAAVCLVLELDRQFSPYFWLNVVDDELPFVGLVEHTNFVPAEVYDGRRFLYVANYVDQQDELLTLTLDELLERYEPGLRRVNPAFSRDWVRNSWLFREPAAQPIVDVGYRARIAPLATPAPGLFLTNTTQVFPEDRGTNYAVKLADQAVAALLAGAPA